MNTDLHSLLLHLYSEWQRLTEIEGDAIVNDDWPRAGEQQRLKRELQDRIVETGERWHVEQGDKERARRRYELEFRPIVNSLIQRELRNQEVLCQRRRHLESGLTALRQAEVRLRAIPRSPAGERAPAWESFS